MNATIGQRGAPKGVPTALAIYAIVIGITALISSVWAWRVAERAAASTTAIDVSYLSAQLSVSAETSIFLVVICFGVLGSTVHVGTSLASYLGNGRFRASWATWYVLRPLIAAALATIAYVAFRAGFLSTQAPADSINLFGVAAVAALAGLFSKQVTDKLEDVMNVVFASQRNGERGDKLRGLKITKVTPDTAPANTPVEVTIDGTAFGPGASVLVGDATHTPTSQTGDRLTLQLSADDLPAAGDTLELRVRTATGDTSEPFALKVT
jgi:hypothetical protein